MRLQGTMEISEKGHLMIGGCDTVELAEQYGTPLLVLDEKEIRDQCRAYRRAFSGQGVEVESCYASKALLNQALCRIMVQEDMGLDVVSGGELYIAKSAGFPMERVHFHGNNKTPAELELALDLGIGRFVVDHVQELELLNQIAKDKGVRADILFRITPGIKPSTHHYIQTGQVDSKFGLVLARDLAFQVIQRALEMPHIRLWGFHSHIGSQIFDLEFFQLAAEVMMDFAGRVRDELGFEVRELNLGGGMGVPYTDSQEPVSIHDYAKVVTTAVKKRAQDLDLPVPKLINEPGRSIIAAAGTTLYMIGSVKEIPEVRTYISVDGGMTDNIRPALYNASYDGMLANRAGDKPGQIVTVAGRCCESGDMLIRDLQLPTVSVGDLLAISFTGAYTYSMSSNYNGLPRPAMVLVKDGGAEVIVRRESYQDLVARDNVPEYLLRDGE